MKNCSRWSVLVCSAMVLGGLVDADLAAQQPARDDAEMPWEAGVPVDPYTRQAHEQTAALRDDVPAVRARAAEALG